MKRTRTILEYLLIFCIILEFYTPYTVSTFTKRVVQLLPIIILGILIVNSRYTIMKKINVYVLIYMAGAVFPLFVLSDQTYMAYILRYIIILPLLWTYLYLRKCAGATEYLSVFFKYSNTMTVLAAVSIIMWLLCSVLQVVPVTAFVPYEWSERDYVPSYWGIYFETQSTSLFDMQIWRNSGIFNEGPMYNMALCVAFAIEYFVRLHTSKTRIWILALTILTTQTTTGQLFLIAIVCWILYKRSRRYFILLVVMAPFLVLGSFFTANRIIEDKIKKGGDVSINDRTEDILTCMEIGMEHPLLGIGLVSARGEQVLWEGKEFGFSNSLFAVFARGGLFGLTLYIVALLLIPYLYYRKYKDARWLFTMTCFFVIFSFTNSSAKYLTFLFLAWGLSNIDLKRINN